MINTVRDVSESFVDLINKYRRPGESNSRFGERMGLKSHKIIRDWEKGQVPKIESLEKIKDKLALPKEEYDDLFYSVYKFIPQQVTRNKNTGKYDTIDKIDYARNLPPNYFLKQIIAFKDAQETEREFARRIGVTDQEWLEGLASKNKPKTITTRRLLNIIKTLDPRGKRNLVNILVNILSDE